MRVFRQKRILLRSFAKKVMAKRTNNNALYGLAKRMFVEDGMNAKAIARALDKPEQTIGRWRKGIGKDPMTWDEERASFLATPFNLKKLLAQELANLVEGHEPSLDLKAIQAAIKALQDLNDEISIEVIYTLFKEFDNWMASQDPEEAEQFMEWHKLFLLEKAKTLS